MSQFTLPNVIQTFPAGTEVGAYAEALLDSGTPRPLGPAIAAAKVAADGSLVFSGLPDEAVDLYAAAKVGGEWRLVRFRTPAPPAESQTIPVGNLKGFVVYDEEAEEWPPRPALQSVEWRGPVEPAEMGELDDWVETP